MDPLSRFSRRYLVQIHRGKDLDQSYHMNWDEVSDYLGYLGANFIITSEKVTIINNYLRLDESWRIQK